MFKQDFWYSLFWGHWGFPKEVKGSKITVWYVLNTILHTYIMLKHPMYKLFTTYSTSWAWISINILLIFLYKNTLESAFTVSVAAIGRIHIWRQMFFGYFWPTCPNQIISLCRKIRCSLIYLPKNLTSYVNAPLPNCIGIYDTISMVISCELGIM